MRILKPGDPCPCCGQPIVTTNESMLLILSAIAETIRLADQQKHIAYRHKPKDEEELLK